MILYSDCSNTQKEIANINLEIQKQLSSPMFKMLMKMKK